MCSDYVLKLKDGKSVEHKYMPKPVSNSKH